MEPVMAVKNKAKVVAVFDAADVNSGIARELKVREIF